MENNALSEGGANTHKHAMIAGYAASFLWLAAMFISAFSSLTTESGRAFNNLSSLIMAPLFIILAIAIGDFFLDLFRVRQQIFARRIISAGIGLGAFSIVTFLVGLVIIPPRFYVWLVIVLVSALLAERAGRVILFLRAKIAAFMNEKSLAAALLVSLIGIVLLMNLFSSFIPPLEYDEMEYHLAGPAKYFRDGRITFVENNAYLAFPANAEMLFLDAMLLQDGVITSLPLGRLMNVSVALLAAIAVGACAGAIFHPKAALFAAAIIYTWPGFGQVTTLAYVEPLLMLYVALAILAAFEYAKLKTLMPLVLLGIFCGLAAGVKYPAIVFLCIPAGIFVLFVAKKKFFAHGIIFTALALAMFSPWMARNLVSTKNPVYPLGYSVFGGENWSPRKDARWKTAHTPKAHWAAVSGAIKAAAFERMPPEIGARQMSLILFAFVPFAFARREWRKRALAVLLLGIVFFAGWLFLTHRIERFLLPWLVPFAIVSAGGAVAFFDRKKLGVAFALIFVLLAANETYATLRTRLITETPSGVRMRMPIAELQLFLGQYSLSDAVMSLTQGTTYSHDSIGFLNHLPHGTLTLFYGEARTLYSANKVIVPTLFDENPLDEIINSSGSADEVASKLKERGITHIYVNLPELHRLQSTYTFRFDNEKWLGYSTTKLDKNPDKEKLVFDFLRDHTEIVYRSVPDVPELKDAAARVPKIVLDDAFISAMKEPKQPRTPIQFFVYKLNK